jgi:hypothetical protein
VVEHIDVSHVCTAQIYITKMETWSSRGSSGCITSDIQMDGCGKTNMYRRTGGLSRKWATSQGIQRLLLGFRYKDLCLVTLNIITYFEIVY